MVLPEGYRTPPSPLGANSWTVGNITWHNLEDYLKYYRHPECAEPNCHYRVWWQNGTMDDAYGPEYRTFCHECAFWHNKMFEDRAYEGGVKAITRRGLGRPSVEHPMRPAIVIEGQTLAHYSFDWKNPVLDPSVRGIRGHSGRLFEIRFFNGSVVQTNNLWSQGPVPLHFLNRFEDNCTLVSGPDVQLRLGGLYEK